MATNRKIKMKCNNKILIKKITKDAASFSTYFNLREEFYIIDIFFLQLICTKCVILRLYIII